MLPTDTYIIYKLIIAHWWHNNNNINNNNNSYADVDFVCCSGKYLIATAGGPSGGVTGKAGELKQIQLTSSGHGTESTSFTQGQVIVQTSSDPTSFTHTQVILPTQLTKYG